MTQVRNLFKIPEFGNPEVLVWVTENLPNPGPGEIQVEHLAIGVNYIDIYHRRGVFAAPLALPSGVGVEGVGRITAIGDGVSGFSIGQRIGYVGGPPGAYASHRNLPAARAVAIPDSLGSGTVAAALFKGLTAEYLVRRCVPVRQGDTVLFHAAAGGVGAFAVQWLRHTGARVIGTAGTPAKVAAALKSGCEHAIDYVQDDFVARVKELTGGRGVDVVYDSVGADTFMKSLDCLRPRGTMVSFGEASGLVPPLSVGLLGAKGSLFLTRPSIAHYTAQRAELDVAAAQLFKALGQGILQMPTPMTYKLADAPRAHADLEARRTTGSVVLIP